SGKESLPATLWRGRFRGKGMGKEEEAVHHYGTSSPGSVVSCSPDSSVASSACSSFRFSNPSTSSFIEPSLMDLLMSASSSSSGHTTEAPPGVVPAPALGIVKLLILDGRILFIDMPYLTSVSASSDSSTVKYGVMELTMLEIFDGSVIVEESSTWVTNPVRNFCWLATRW